MTDQTSSLLAALQSGEIAAALVLADHCQDIGHPDADKIASLAQQLQETESFLEMFSLIGDIMVAVGATDIQPQETQA